ncbi:hypothetical protein PP353_gp63 [Arthrobacter phage Kumotta]|uniref:Uncharacterized protein n=2 Tax=Kumottavirus TaxID=3044749 RepID=A0A4Y6EM71_9CAUD|nr:hypothetical protein PP353_gp63 [Arthrobacter phage Kumotta]YP_010649541.1 hypothetical protein PP356_gp59 [Arthrobacter phage MargaretKali]AXH44439.1 hypothetical protein SEA_MARGARETKALI_59 [Arthrobacter phage MargaretKali]QDF19572.1 hypothetical protein SEA_KUMOTTA_63 [Arthrobacter phage Kumotta]
MITENQAKALASLLHEIRPKWSIPAMLKLLEKNHTHPAPFHDITVAAVTAARDPKVETPGAIFIDQRFWPAETKTYLPKPPPCADHIGESATNCRSCWADVKTGLRPVEAIGKHHQPESEDDNEPPASP